MKSLADLDYKAKKLYCKEKKLDIENHRRELEEKVSAFTRTAISSVISNYHVQQDTRFWADEIGPNQLKSMT